MADNKLRISGHTTSDFLEEGSIKVDAQFNPETFKISSSILSPPTKKINPNGTTGTEPEEIKPVDLSLKTLIQGVVQDYQTISFTLKFDCTVVDSNSKFDFAGNLTNCLLFTKVGNSAKFVKVSALPFLNFHGILNSVEINYLMFDQEMNPMRAEVTFSLKGINKVDEIKKMKSPNTGESTMSDGEKIANYVAKRLGSAALTVAVAKSNKLPSIMGIKSGTKIKIPGKKK